MAYQAKHKEERGLLFRETFNDEQTVRRNSGVPSGAVTFEQGEAIFTTDGKITLSKIASGVKTIRIIVDLDTINGDILTLSSSHSVEVGLSDVSATGLASPTIYVDGVLTSAITTNKAEIVITTATAFDADTIILGFITTYLEGKIDYLELWDYVWSSSEAANSAKNARYADLYLRSDLQEILNVSGQKGSVPSEDKWGNAIANTGVTIQKDGEVNAFEFDGAEVLETTLADDINTVSLWIKPKTDTESIIDLGGGNTITTSGGTLTAAWADDLFVNGKVGTAVTEGIWNLITCRVDIAIAVTAIDIGKISAAFYSGLMNNISFITGVTTDDEESQRFTSSKQSYNL